MSDYIKGINILLIGAGNMAKEHAKVLKKLNKNFLVIGRGEKSARNFEKEVGMPVYRSEIEKVIRCMDSIPTYAIVAVGVENLAKTTLTLISLGVKKILVEKPAGMDLEQIEKICQMAVEKNSKVFVGYNRRFYSSVEKAREIVKKDGGVLSLNFEFTEWPHTIEPLDKPEEVKKVWLLANSTHVIDLAFFFGGRPRQIKAYVQGELSWHPSGSMYCGAGVTEQDALFSYNANWEAPGRWGVEVLTKSHRLYFRPLEQLAIQENKTIKVQQVEIDDSLDRIYKPGVFKMINTFLKDVEDDRLVTIEEHYKNSQYYKIIAEGN